MTSVTVSPTADPEAQTRVLPPLDVLVVVGGNHSHDYGFVRPELLTLLGRGRALRLDVQPDFSDVDALARADRLISYTCDVRPTDAQEDALERFVRRGGRWLALHSTNALFDVEPVVRIVDTNQHFFDVLGSKFVGHPPIRDFGVRVASGPVAQQLFGDVDSFTTSDELYGLEHADDIEVLLEVDGPSGVPDPGGAPVPPPGHPLAYVRSLGDGQVLYLSLGHAGSPTHPHGTHRCSWITPQFRTILERTVDWLLAPVGIPAGAVAGVS